jgi:MarR family transcriptional regulator, organic hydroperoxide resistance regulator
MKTSNKERFPPLSTSLPAFVRNGSDAEFRALIYELTSLFNIMQRNRRHFGSHIGVSESQALILMILAEASDVTVGSIARRLEVSSQFVTIEVGKLVARNLVEKRPNESDRRSVFLKLTEEGEGLLRELAPLRRNTNDTMFRSLDRERARTLRAILADVIADGRLGLHDLQAPRPGSPAAEHARSSVGARRKAATTTPTFASGHAEQRTGLSNRRR